MAPFLFSCIRCTFYSHREAACFLLVTLIPFSFPFLILCLPMLLLLLPPISVLLLFLLLFHKVQVSMRSRIPGNGALMRQAVVAGKTFLEDEKDDREGRELHVLHGSVEAVGSSSEQQDIDASAAGDARRSQTLVAGLNVLVQEEHGDDDDIDDAMRLGVMHEIGEKREGVNTTAGMIESCPDVTHEIGEKRDELNITAGMIESCLHTSSIIKDDEMPPKDAGEDVFDIDPHSGDQGQGNQEPHRYVEQGSSTGNSASGDTDKPEKQNLHALIAKQDEQDRPSSSSIAEGAVHRPGVGAFVEELHSVEQLSTVDERLELQPTRAGEPFEAGHPMAPSSHRLVEVAGSQVYVCHHLSVASPPERPAEGVRSQDKIQEEHLILEDIHAIKKIVGYKGETHVSAMEEIAALYLFLGMEPYAWDVELDELERARAEVELLKAVVGVK